MKKLFYHESTKGKKHEKKKNFVLTLRVPNFVFS